MSDWKIGANKRRDERNTKTSDEPKKSTQVSKNKKDTKKWCKGKIGVEHKLECKDYNEIKKIGLILLTWKILICTVCGKELDVYFGNENKPHWVK